MTNRTTLDAYLASSQASDDVSAVVAAMAGAAQHLSRLLGRGPLAGNFAEIVGEHQDGDRINALDARADELIAEALRRAPVAAYCSEEVDEPIWFSSNAPLVVAADPLDGSSNVDCNMTVGTIFSVLPNTGTHAFEQRGDAQLAAGVFVYGPQLALLLTVGDGTHIFTFDENAVEFVRTSADVQVPAGKAEYAINGSNYRHWPAPVRAYVDDCNAGARGPRMKDFNTRWVASMVADAYRILVRGGVYLYPGDARDGYTDGRQRLLYEGHPLAMLMEQAGAAATNGSTRLLELGAATVHQHTPMIFGDAEEVACITEYLGWDARGVLPLFAARGLLREG